MIRRLLFVPLLAALPALVCAQEKLVNCRTLEAAGNFVGPDEVVVNDMVCQKLKAGAKAIAALPAPTPVIGTVISSEETTNVVDAARAASKRVEAAKVAIKERAAQSTAETANSAPVSSEPDAQPSGAAQQPVAPPEPAQTAVSQPVVEKPEANVPANPATAESPAPQVVPALGEQAAKPATLSVEPARQPAPVPTTIGEQPAAATNASNPPAPTPSPLPASAPAPQSTEPAKPEQIQDPRAQDAVGSFVDAVSHATASRNEDAASPKNDAATTPAVAATPGEITAKLAAQETAASEQPAPASAAASQAETNPQPEPASASGFYDANAGANVVTNLRPEPKAAGPTPEELAARKLAEEEAQASLMAPDPNLPREHVVATGGFVLPKEEGPDPALEAHKTTFQPGDSEGFEEGHRPECTKNITIAGLKGEKLVLGTPSWAAKWIEKNQKRIPDVCFSDTPMTGARNYLIVFYTSPLGADSGAAGNDKIAADAASPGGVGGFTLSYGSTWHYAQERNVGTTILTRDEADEPQSDIRNVWHATAYTESGVPVAEHWPEKLTKQIPASTKQVSSKKTKEAHAEVERVSDDLLGDMVGDVAKL